MSFRVWSLKRSEEERSLMVEAHPKALVKSFLYDEHNCINATKGSVFFTQVSYPSPNPNKSQFLLE